MTLDSVQDRSQYRPSVPRIAEWTSIATASATLALLASSGIVVGSFVRGREDEFLAGVVSLILSLFVTLRLFTTERRVRALPVLMSIGWTVQLGATLYYYYSDIARDARTYHSLAARFAARPLLVDLPTARWGDEGIALVLSVVYRLTGPSMLLGFIVFAALGFTGKVLLARTLLRNRDALGTNAELGAVAVMLLPSLNIWLGAISKESLAVFGTGLVLAGLVRGARPARVGMVAAGLATVALVRPHVSLLLSAAVLAYLTTTFALPRRWGGRRIGLIAASGVIAAATLIVAAAFLESDASPRQLEERRQGLAGAVDPGGSTIDAVAITSPADVPQAMANVLLRPFPWEISSLTTAAQSAETLILLVGTFALIINRRRRAPERVTGALAVRVRGMRAFGAVYTTGFIYAFSITYNLGLVSRQRSQLWLPLMLLLVAVVVRTRRSGTSGPAARAPIDLRDRMRATEPR